MEEITDDKQKFPSCCGIDFGTCNSCIGIWRNNTFEVIPDEKGNHSIPSIIAFTNRTHYVGYEAKNQSELNPNVFNEIKRLLGKKMDDETIISDSQFLNYKLVQGKNNNVVIQTNFENHKYHKYEYSPEELASMIFTKLKNMACEYLEEDITNAIVAVPAYFNDAQRQATKDAMRIAGLNCIRVINEPVASALAYGLHKLSKLSDKDVTKNIIVYDLGGGTLDVSLVSITEGLFEVIASVGNTHLGGVDFDNRIYSYCLNVFKKEHKLTNLDNINKLSLQKLRRSCENAKKILSNNQKVIIGVTEFYNNQDLVINLTKQKFEELCSDLFIICLKPLEDILTACKFEKKQIDEIILVGGMTRVPLIRYNITKFFDKPPNSSINPDEAVAVGASIQGYILSHKSDPFSESVTLMDVTSLSLGVETIGGVMNVMIPRGTPMPFTNTKMFSNDTDNDESIIVKVFEGERMMTKDNFLVGDFELTGLSKAPRGYHRIEVTFHINVDGIITVTAEDTRNNIKNSIRTNGNKGRLSEEQIDLLVKESTERELIDRVEKKKKKFYYKVDEICGNILKNLNDPELNIREVEKKSIIEDVQSVMEWLKEKSYIDRNEDEYKSILERLNKKYCILVLKASEQAGKIQAITGSASGTSVFQDGEEHDIVFEKIVKEELGLSDDISETEKNEIIQMRDNLLEQCHTIYNIITSNQLNIKKDHIEELKDYIEDVIVWTHVQQQSTIKDYQEKLKELDTECDKLMEYYNGNVFDNNPLSSISSKDELEQLCLTLKSSLMSNLFSLDEEKIKLLDEKINDTLDWMIKTAHLELSNDTYKEKISEINTMCVELNKSILCQTTNSNIKVI